MIPSLEGWPTKAKEAPSPHEVRLTSLDTNPVFQCVGDARVYNSTRYRREKTKGRFDFSKVSLKAVIIRLIQNCYSNVENLTMKQSIGISMG